MRVTLTGGEALSRPDFFKLVDGIIENRMRYSILSNGTLVTERTLAEFEKGKRPPNGWIRFRSRLMVPLPKCTTKAGPTASAAPFADSSCLKERGSP